jgi:S-adenosylmethionine decarboxylase
MAFNDTLFQLGMDLTRSSPAHEEDIVAGSACVESGDQEIFFAERDSVRFAGSHLIVDLIGAKRIEDLKHVEQTVRRCVRSAGSSLVSAQLSRSSGRGVASFDVFMSNDADAYGAVDLLRTAFGAREAVLKAHKPCEALPSHVLHMVRKAKPTAKPARVQRTKKAA